MAKSPEPGLFNDPPSTLDDRVIQDLEKDLPLALQLRPGTLDELIGQTHLSGPGGPLRLALKRKRLPSLLFYGPPGTGKTSLAFILARALGARLTLLNAAQASVGQLRNALEEAQRAREQGQQTVVFLDEIHRFSKTQQDSLLSSAEQSITPLIGATTENPFFAITPALRSRLTLYELYPLTPQELEALLYRGLDHLQLRFKGLGIEDAARDLLIQTSGGDGRILLNRLELSAQYGLQSTSSLMLTKTLIEKALVGQALTYNRSEAHYDTASALIKSMRAGEVNAGLYYLVCMLNGGDDPRFIARRLVIFASEDIGNTDPTALLLASACATAVALVGLPEARLTLAQAVIYLCRAPKSNAVLRALSGAQEALDRYGSLPVPEMLADTHYKGAKKRGHGEGYIYPHSDPAGAQALTYLPEKIKDLRFYEPPQEHIGPRSFQKPYEKKRKKE